MDYSKLKKKVESLNAVLKNTKDYRVAWDDELKDMIKKTLEEIQSESGIAGEIIVHDQFQGLESVSLVLGSVDSGIYERVSEKVKKTLIRMNGVLAFQQMFNGKISIWINYPYIEGIGEPKQPKMLEIVRPHELQEINILRYVETFIDELTQWEDYDDDLPPAPGIGFNHQAASIK